MDVFSNLMVVGECLLDGPRTRAFERAIARVVRPGHTVLDVGTGSGILAMFSARAGARRVLAVDIATDIVQFARANVVDNGLAETIEVHAGDVRFLPAYEGIDVLTMELMDTWLVAEQQAAALNALHANGTIRPATALVPYRYQCLIELIEYDFRFYGFRMPFVIQARNFAVKGRVIRRLSPAQVVSDLSFLTPLEPEVSHGLHVPVEDDGDCNAAVLSARTFLAPGITVGSTSDMNMPVIVPLPRRRVRRGETLHLCVSYSMGAGFSGFEISYVAQPPRAAARLDSRHPAHPGP